MYNINLNENRSLYFSVITFKRLVSEIFTFTLYCYSNTFLKYLGSYSPLFL